MDLVLGEVVVYSASNNQTCLNNHSLVKLVTSEKFESDMVNCETCKEQKKVSSDSPCQYCEICDYGVCYECNVKDLKAKEDDTETAADDYDHDCEAYQICNTCLDMDQLQYQKE